MRILLLTQWFDPEPTFKGLLFARALQRQGHEVQVLTGFPNYPGGRVYPGYQIRPFRREVVDGVPILRVPLFPSHDNSAVRRALNYLSFASSASIAVLGIKRPDVAYVYHPPATSALPALVLKLMRGVPFVYDIQDLWPDTLAATGMVSSHAALTLVRRGMRRIYDAAAEIVVLSEGFRRRLTDGGVSASKVAVIPNWAAEDHIHVDRAQGTGPPGPRDTFTVVFAGTMGKAQALTTVLDAAYLMRSESRVRFILVGGGIEAGRLQGVADERRLRNVVFLPRMPVSEIGEILTKADALLVHLSADPLFEITIPSKTAAYLMVGKPILMGVAGDAARIVEQARAGVTFEPENAASLAAAINTLMTLSPTDRATLGAAGKRYYEEHLSLEVGVAAFLHVLGRAARTGRHAHNVSGT